MKKILLVLTISLLLTIIGIHRISVVYAYYQAEVESSDTSVDESLYDTSSFRNQTYYRKLLSWLESYDYIQMPESAISLDSFVASNPLVTFENVSDYSSCITAALDENDTLSVNVTVDETGLYELGIDFIIPDAFYTVPTISVTVNGETLYNEMSALELDVAWQIVPLDESVRYNRYGNELLPKSVSVSSWKQYYFDDYNSNTIGNYQFLLNEGVNVITITALNIPLNVGQIFLKGKEDYKSYQEYSLENLGLPSTSDGQMIVIQGESFVKKNDLEVKSSYYKESAMTPYSYKSTVLNQLDGASVSRGGSKVYYEFTVSNEGYYNISLKALQNSNMGVASGKNFYIDGEVLFSELTEYTFDSGRKWHNVGLQNNDGLFSFYFTEGTHSLEIESTVSQYQAYIDELNTIMDHISSISLLVKTITGGNPDDAIDWDILKYIPDLKEQLLSYADELESIYVVLNNMDHGYASSPELSTLNVAATQLRRVAKLPNKIGSKLNEFSDGSGSAYQLIGNSISRLLYNPLSIDQIYIYNNVELPRETGTFFRRVWDSIRSFFYSFFDTRYNDNAIDSDTLEVWVGQSSLYLDIIQSMIDQDFTASTGIKVKASILSNTSKIVLSNATHDNPDVVLSIDNWNPYAYALRGMLTDLKSYDDFDSVSSNYYANNFTPVIFEDGVYAIPETQSVFLLYYRKDILDYLDLDVPDTWDDVINMLPILQSHQMNFFHPLGGDAAYKGFGYTSSLIYQFGGEIYTEDGVSSTLRDQNTISAIQFMTNLFTIYDLPLQVSSFFEHFRTGDMPVGISTIDLYLQLKYAAPELSGQWGVTVIPGIDTYDTGEVQRWSTTYGKCSIQFANSDMQEEGWELIKWWNSTTTQTTFMQNIKTGLGEKFLILSANMNALKQSVWDQDIVKQMVEQAKWSRIPAVTPGSYIVERELSSIWNKIVIDLDNVSVAINESIPRITRELDRKFDEFGYYSSENPNGIPYIVPMNSNISRWISEAYHDEE